MKKLDNLSFLIVTCLIVLNLFVWFRIVFGDDSVETQFSFLDVGQGDGTLGIFGGGVKFLVDAGPGPKTMTSLQEVLNNESNYIDLAFITHPQLDHFGGFNFILDRFEVGAFVLNGRMVDLAEWQELMEKIKTREIPVIVLGAGDEIKYRDNRIHFLSPDNRQLQSGELNDSSLVNLIETPEGRVLLTGDISMAIEKYLLDKYGAEIFDADILKVPHHGSKYSLGSEFLESVSPFMAFIEVGKNNYGHPTPEILERLKDLGTPVFRTDLMGSMSVVFKDGQAKVFGLK